MVNKKNEISKINQNYIVDFEKLDNRSEEETTIKKQDRQIVIWFKKNWKYLLGVLVTIGLLIYLVMYSGPAEIFNTLKDSNYQFVLVSFGLTIILFLVKTIRWKIILFKQSCKLSFLETMKLVLIGTFGSSITPGKIGDILRAYYLTKNHPETKIGTSVFSVVFDRILDLGSILIIGLLSCPIIFIGNKVKFGEFHSYLILSLIVIAVIIFLVYNKKATKRIINLILKITTKVFRKREASEKINITTEQIIDDFYKSQKKYLKRDYLLLGILSILFWLIIGIQGYLLLFACKVTNIDLFIDLLIVISILCIAAVIAFAVPFSISGIGIRDSIIVLLFGLILGIPSEKALILSIIQTFLNVLLPAVIGAILMIFSGKGKKNMI